MSNQETQTYYTYFPQEEQINGLLASRLIEEEQKWQSNYFELIRKQIAEINKSGKEAVILLVGPGSIDDFNQLHAVLGNKLNFKIVGVEVDKKRLEEIERSVPNGDRILLGNGWYLDGVCEEKAIDFDQVAVVLAPNSLPYVVYCMYDKATCRNSIVGSREQLESDLVSFFNFVRGKNVPSIWVIEGDVLIFRPTGDSCIQVEIFSSKNKASFARSIVYFLNSINHDGKLGVMNFTFLREVGATQWLGSVFATLKRLFLGFN